MKQDSRHASRLAADKFHLALDRLRERQSARKPSQRIAPRGERSGPPPLSFAQESLWLLEQLAPGGSAYLIPAAVRLSGPLHVAGLTASLTEIVRRHEVLRTAYPAIEGRPSQEIAEPRPVALPVVDLAGPGAGEAEASRLVAAESGRGFDLARGPILRFVLLRLAAAE